MKRSPLLVVFITIFIDMLGFGIIIPILPNYTKDLGATALEVGLIAGVYSLMNFFFSPFWGTLSDRYGRKPIILISIIITGSSYFLFAFSNTLALVFLARLFAGIGSANIATVQACVADISKPENRTKMMGIIGAAFGLGFIFGPPVGGFVKHHYGIEWVGFIAMGLCIINLVMAFFLLRKHLRKKILKQNLPCILSKNCAAHSKGKLFAIYSSSTFYTSPHLPLCKSLFPFSGKITTTSLMKAWDIFLCSSVLHQQLCKRE